jgi:uncharacterized membrane protein
MSKIVIFGLSALYATLSVVGASLIKLTLNSWGEEQRGLASVKDYFAFLFEPKVFFGMGIIFVSALVLFKALSLSDFSYVIPVSAAVNFILTASVAAVFFGEKLAWNNIVGIALIIAGVFVINLKRA